MGGERGICLIVLSLLLIGSASAAIVDSSLENIPDGKTVDVLVTIDNGKLFTTSSLNTQLEVAEELEQEYDVEYVGKSFNGITLSVNSDEIEELQQRMDIKEIKKIPEFKTLLQDSARIINSTLVNALQLNGINLTGTGQGICIIDSGVNYTHPALGGCTKEQFLAGDCTKVVGGYAFYNPVNLSNPNDIIENESNHGTHVAGIAVGNGPLRGIAPGAHIAVVKACGPSSSCDLGAVVDGINWCVGNATTYNLSTISISIGTSAPDVYSSNCDAEVSALTSAINSAVGKNISVVISSGNDANKTHISLPACISNATAVSATDKNDVLASYGNRNSLVKLVAPGNSINSSVLSGGYDLLSGTSMAAPHVSGIIALLRQALASISVTKTTSEITSLLNDTGKTVTDTTGISYSRVNAYDAVLTLDQTPPNVSLEYPNNAINSTNSTQSFNASFSDWQLQNATLFVWNSSDDIVYNSTVNVTGKTNITTLSVSNLSVGNYTWTFNATDIRGNRNTTTARNLTIIPLIAISPVDGYNEASNMASIEFNFSLHSGVNFSNCSLIINSVIQDTINITNTSNYGNQNITATFGTGTYIWKIVCRYLSSIDETSNRTFTVTALPVAPVVGSSSSGGGGGGAAATVFKPDETSTNNGYTQTLKKQEKVQFTLFDRESEKHTLTVDTVTEVYANITIRSNPIKLTLGVGQSAKLNLTSSEFYDLFVKLEKIENKKATLTIQTIFESRISKNIINGNAIADQNITEDEEKIVPIPSEPNKTPLYVWIFVFLGVIGLTALIVHEIDIRKKS